MVLAAQRLFRVGLGFAALAVAVLVVMPVAEAQFFQWFDERPRKPKRRVPVKPRLPPGDDLPPIVPRESTAPPPPDDRPYDTKLLRLAEILGAVHYLRELCGAEEGQVWREQMKEIIKNEGTTATRRAKFVNSFNDGYRGYRRTYRSCTPSATLAVTRFTSEGARIASALAKTSKPASPKPANGASPEAGGSENGEQPPADAEGEAAAETGSIEAPADQAPAAAPETPQQQGSGARPLHLGARVNR